MCRRAQHSADPRELHRLHRREHMAAPLRNAGMALRTPRRRISPRTKQRYRAIRQFFRRAIGNTSEQVIKINSSIALNVSDLKHKIGGIEHRTQGVNRQCQHFSCLNNDIDNRQCQHISCLDNDIADRQCQNFCCFENNISRGDEWSEEEREPVKEQTEASSENKCLCTQVLYKNSSNNYRKLEESVQQRSVGRLKSNEQQTSKVENKKSKSKDTVKKNDSGLRSYNTHSNLGSFYSDYSTSSFHSLHQSKNCLERDYERSGRRETKKHARRSDVFEISFNEGKRKQKRMKEDKFEILPCHEEQLSRKRKCKQGDPKIDESFIADIIRRQYKPIKLIGRRDSEMSQFSAPVCRDQEHLLEPNRKGCDKVKAGTELCSCYYEEHRRRPKYIRCNDLSDIRSICDTRMYSSKRHARHRHRRRYTDMYSDSTLYDMVPVREKSSPKSRRRYAYENMIAKDYYREVPPSPRTHRPRLNLKAQYYEYEDLMPINHPNQRYVIMKPGRHQECTETFDSETASEMLQRRMRRERKEFLRHLKEQNVPVQIPKDVGVINNLQNPVYVDDKAYTATNDLSLNKTQDTDASVAEKTDKTLSEIKEILQNFLQELKKEAIPPYITKSETTANYQAEQSDKVKEINPVTDNTIDHNVAPYLNTAFTPQFTNPYCYPVMPVCPMNYSGYVLPSPSFSCHACFNNSACAKHTSTSGKDDEGRKNETEELIKEIYKYVAQSSSIGQKNKRERNSSKENVLTSRSAGGSTLRTRRRNAKIGTKTVKCYSKSCEAIGSRLTDSGKTTASLSDTVLDKLSLEVSESIAESVSSSESIDLKKKKPGKLTKVLRTFGFLKKKKKFENEFVEEEIEEEESESEETAETKPKARRKHGPPFKQHLQSYMMYGQEYYQRPPMPPYSPRGPGHYGYHTPPLYGQRGSPYHMGHGEVYTPHEVHCDTIHEHAPSSFYRYDRQYPSAPPYPYDSPPPPHVPHHAPHHVPHHAVPHAQPHPQEPLCLKEIEVKSMGTQSERKLSFLRKLTTKPPPRAPPPQPEPQQQKPKPKWLEGLNKTEGNKGLMDILKGLKVDYEDPQTFKYRTQRELAEGDKKMRNAMLKKIFYKRNPFSPNNLVMKTLLGHDQASYGNPGVILKNRLLI